MFLWWKNHVAYRIRTSDLLFLTQPINHWATGPKTRSGSVLFKELRQYQRVFRPHTYLSSIIFDDSLTLTTWIVFPWHCFQTSQISYNKPILASNLVLFKLFSFIFMLITVLSSSSAILETSMLFFSSIQRLIKTHCLPPTGEQTNYK